MSEFRRILLARHGETSENLDRQGRRRITRGAIQDAKLLGRRLVQAASPIDLSVMAVSPKFRTQETALAVAKGAKLATPELVTCDFLDELDLVNNGQYTRTQLIELVRDGRPPRDFINRGVNILSELPELDPRVQFGITHASVVVAIQYAQLMLDRPETRAIRSPHMLYGHLHPIEVTVPVLPSTHMPTPEQPL